MASDPVIEPTSIPEWGSAASPSDLADPGSTLRGTAWTPTNRKPTRQHLNWLLNAAYLWFLYLADLVGWLAPIPFIPPEQDSPEPLQVTRTVLDLDVVLGGFKAWINGSMRELAAGSAPTYDLTPHLPATTDYYRWIVAGIYHDTLTALGVIEGAEVATLPGRASIPATGRDFLPLIAVLLKSDGSVLDQVDMRRSSPYEIDASNVDPRRMDATLILQPDTVDFSLLAPGSVYEEHHKDGAVSQRALAHKVLRVVEQGAGIEQASEVINMNLDVLDLDGGTPSFPVDVLVRGYQQVNAVIDHWEEIVSGGGHDINFEEVSGDAQIEPDSPANAYSPFVLRVTDATFILRMRSVTPVVARKLMWTFEILEQPGVTARFEFDMAAVP